MIKPEELRIGNYVQKPEEIVVTDIDQFGVNGYYCEVLGGMDYDDGGYFKDINPIPLTEEWLLSLRFDDLGTYGYGIGEFHIRLNDKGKLYFPINGKKVIIKYVHQLQNLFFALTNKELTIMKNYYFTFGGNHRQIDGTLMRSYWVRVVAESYNKARTIFTKEFSSKYMHRPTEWCWQYEEKGFDGDKYFPLGEYACYKQDVVNETSTKIE